MTTRTCRSCGRDRPVAEFGQTSAYWTCTTCRATPEETAQTRAAREAAWQAGTAVVAETLGRWIVGTSQEATPMARVKACLGRLLEAEKRFGVDAVQTAVAAELAIRKAKR